MPVFQFCGSRGFSPFAPRKSFFEFSGNRSALILLLEYPGKTDGAVAGNLREPVLDRLFCFGHLALPSAAAMWGIRPQKIPPTQSVDASYFTYRKAAFFKKIPPTQSVDAS